MAKFIMPKVTVDQLRTTIHNMPTAIRENYGRRHFALASYVISKYTDGMKWGERNVLARALGDASAPGIFQMDNSTDEIREGRSTRLMDLAEIILNLQLVEGFDECMARLNTGDHKQVEATYAELQFGKIFYLHDMNFRFVVPEGKVKGADYDFEFAFPRFPVVCADVKCKLEGSDFRPKSVLNSLDEARSRNLPADKPGIIFVKVPQEWFVTNKDVVADELRKVARDFLRSTGRVVSIKYYISHLSFEKETTIHQHGFDEIDNPKSRFPRSS